MKKGEKQFRVHTPLQDNILSLTAIVSLIVLTLIAVSGVLWLLVQTGVLSYDWWHFDPPTEESVTANPADGVFDALRPGSSANEDTANEIIRFSGSFFTLRALLADLDAPDSYNAVFETVIYADKTASRRTVRVCRLDDSYRIEHYDDGASLQTSPTGIYVCDGTAVVYTDTQASTSARFPISASFTVEALAGIPSIASFNTIPDEQILHASYTEMNGELVYYVLYATPTAADSQILHEIWISAETELVRRCNTYLCADGDDPFVIIADPANTVFSSELLSVSALSEKEKRDLFVLPDTAQ